LQAHLFPHSKAQHNCCVRHCIVAGTSLPRRKRTTQLMLRHCTRQVNLFPNQHTDCCANVHRINSCAAKRPVSAAPAAALGRGCVLLCLFGYLVYYRVEAIIVFFFCFVLTSYVFLGGLRCLLVGALPYVIVDLVLIFLHRLRCLLVGVF
jgi:hypothetical protein